jgi:glycosyltransferase involved in cell wall biosynthesis
VFRDVDLFVAPSRQVRDRFIEEGLPQSKVVVCTHGIIHDILPAGYRRAISKDQPLRCGFVGTVASYKGMDVLLEAFETGCRCDPHRVRLGSSSLPGAGPRSEGALHGRAWRGR